jgi:hypothetical protein
VKSIFEAGASPSHALWPAPATKAPATAPNGAGCCCPRAHRPGHQCALTPARLHACTAVRWLQDLPADAGGYSFSAPVLKEREYRLDGLFSPPAQRPDLRDWRVVVICPNRRLNFRRIACSRFRAGCSESLTPRLPDDPSTCAGGCGGLMGLLVQPSQISRSSIRSPGNNGAASRPVAASMRAGPWAGSPAPPPGHTSTACRSGMSSQPSWAPLAW